MGFREGKPRLILQTGEGSAQTTQQERKQKKLSKDDSKSEAHTRREWSYQVVKN